MPRPESESESESDRRPAPELAHRARTRFLAVGGLTGLAAAVVIIVAGNGHQSARLAPAAERVAVHPRYWVVRPGQSFAMIAARESTTPAALERLNPRLLPGSLPPGARVLLPD